MIEDKIIHLIASLGIPAPYKHLEFLLLDGSRSMTLGDSFLQFIEKDVTATLGFKLPAIKFIASDGYPYGALRGAMIIYDDTSSDSFPYLYLFSPQFDKAIEIFFDHALSQLIFNAWQPTKILFLENFELIELSKYWKLGNVTSLPPANVGERGKMIRVEGGTGVADKLYCCMKKADGTYAWVQIASG